MSILYPLLKPPPSYKEVIGHDSANSTHSEALMEIMLTESIQTQDELPANLPMAKELESTIGHTTPAIRETRR